MAKEITNYEDVIDSRDVIERLTELAAQWQKHANDSDADALTEEETAELESLRKLSDEAEGYIEDWIYGAALIRDSYFEEYAQQLAEDIGAIPEKLSWPCSCIDWEQAVGELQYDYISVDFDGVAYWAR